MLDDNGKRDTDDKKKQRPTQRNPAISTNFPLYCREKFFLNRYTQKCLLINIYERYAKLMIRHA